MSPESIDSNGSFLSLCLRHKVITFSISSTVTFELPLYAAYNGRDEVTVEDIEEIITLCLRHRLRKDPLESIDSGDKVQTVFDETFK